MMSTIIVRYAELGLKGENRSFFERKLLRNIKSCLKNNKVEYKSLKRLRGRIILEADEKALSFLHLVFGISSVSVAIVVPLDLEKIKEAALEYAKKEEFSTFRVTGQRMNKNFPMNSMDMKRVVGEVIFETLHKKVSLKNPELNLQIEVFDKAYIFSKVVECSRGLPIGCQGKVLILLGEEDSELAAILMMRRGCAVALCGFKKIESPLIKNYNHGCSMKFYPIKEIEEVDKIAVDTHSQALVVADNLGSIKEYNVKILTLRPLVGQDIPSLKKRFTCE